MEFFVKKFIKCLPLTIFVKSFILDVWLDSVHDSERYTINDVQYVLLTVM